MTKFTMRSDDLFNDLKDHYDIICFEDLGRLSRSRDLIYKLFQQHHQTVYDAGQRLVLYSQKSIPKSFLEHILTAANLVDISINFILLVCPDEGKLLESFDILYPEQGNHFDVKNISIEDAELFSPESEYHIPDSICPLPWISIAVTGDGKMMPCCVYETPVTTDTNQSEKYNINWHTPEEYYHSRHLKQLRQALLEGQKPQGCRWCWYKEKNGNKSLRQHALSWYGKTFFSQSPEDSIDHVINLDLDFGNLCNLKCRICHFDRSSLIAAEILTHGDRYINISKDTVRQFNKNAKWVTDPEKISKFDGIFPNLENLEIEGGEMFLHDYHSQFLYQKMIEPEYASNVRLRFSSNGTIFPDHRLWPQFKEIQLNLSIDDIDQRFEYQRDGAPWSTVVSVLDQYQQLDYANLNISFWVVVSMQNIFYLPELIDRLKSYNWEFQFSLLKEPKQLSIENLTQTAKQAILDKFKKYQSNNESDFQIIKFVYDAVLQVTPSDGREFWEFVDYHDQIRSKYYHDSHPEMAELMNKV